MHPSSVTLQSRLYARFEAPPLLKLSEWAEANIVLPEGTSHRPGKYRNWPYLRDILDDIGDPAVERITLMKGARIGFTKGLIIAIAAAEATDPHSIGLLMPTEQDAAEIGEDEVDPLFEATPALRRLVTKSTKYRKRFVGGGSLRLLFASAARRLRRIDLKSLFADEVDGMSLTDEGDPIAIAEGRTRTHADRKIVLGGTPTEESISRIDQAYKASDQRIFEIPCPHCGAFFELKWECIRWPKERPEDAFAICPYCEKLEHAAGVVAEPITERMKRGLVELGEWRVTKPENTKTGGHGYQCSALVSNLPKATWGILAGEYVEAVKAGPAGLMPFKNLVLGLPFRTTIGNLTADTLQARVENFGLIETEEGQSRIPEWVLMLTCGADVQDDRIEATILGWAAAGAPAVLGHFVFEGNTLHPEVWKDFDQFLRTRWRHPNGWQMRIDGTAVDSGGHEGRTQKVYDFCAARVARRVFAIKAQAKDKPIWRRAQKVKGNARLYIIGIDQVKTAAVEALAAEPFNDEGEWSNIHAVRISNDIADDYPDWFDQVTGEVRRVNYVKTRMEFKWELKRTGQRVEALDCLCYGWAVRYSPLLRMLDLKARSARQPDPVASPPPLPIPGVPERTPASNKPASIANWAARFNS